MLFTKKKIGDSGGGGGVSKFFLIDPSNPNQLLKIMNSIRKIIMV